jgi:hypothetical protein
VEVEGSVSVGCSWLQEQLSMIHAGSSEGSRLDSVWDMEATRCHLSLSSRLKT